MAAVTCEAGGCKRSITLLPIKVKGENADESFYQAAPVPSNGWLIAISKAPNKPERLVILCPDHNATGEKWQPTRPLDQMPAWVLGLIESGMVRTKCKNSLCEREFITREKSALCPPCRNAAAEFL